MSVLENIITKVRSENPNIYMDFVSDYLSKRNYSLEDGDNALKNKYQELLSFFREKSHNENKTNQD
jgi:hypothetical protein